MCGIAGYCRNTERTSIPNGRRFGVALSHGIESRGRDATGFAWQEQKDDSNVWYSKDAGPATRVAHRLALPGSGITNLLAHTRFATLGGSDNVDNVHPVVAGPITVTHNGRVENHDELVKLSGLERIGEVDSWAIPALLCQQEALGADHPTELLELIHGVAAIAWLDANEPGVVHLARLSTRPLTIGWTKRGDLVYSSTRATLALGAAKGGVGVTDVIDIPEGTYLRVRDGAFEEWSEFKVNPPAKQQADLDMPGAKSKPAKKAKRKGQSKGQMKLPPYTNMFSSVSDYDPDLDMSTWEPSDEDLLAGFDSWEENMRNRGYAHGITDRFS
jgi:glutamine phosphoribosylpyrophosphate amidotransferase